MGTLKEIWEWTKAILVMGIILSIIILGMYSFFRVMDLESKNQYDEYCELRYGKGFEDTAVEVQGIQTCIKISLENQTAEKRYNNLSDYNRDCPMPRFFDITDWTIECKLNRIAENR